MTKRAYKYRFYPTPEQEILLAKTFGCTRFVYNEILRWRNSCFEEKKEKVNYSQASAKLTELKKEERFNWLNEVSSVPLQQCLRHQQTAFKNFFEGRARFPAFKKKNHRQSITLTSAAFKYRDSQLFIAKSKAPLAIRWSRPLPSEPSTVNISKDASGRYFVSCLCDFEPVSLPVNKNIIGIDVGLSSLFVTSDGVKIDNPRNTKKYAAQLALAQRRLSRKKLGSANRAKARAKVARIHAKIADSRLDYLHKITSALINENQVVCIESIAVKNLIKNRCLAKAIADASWGEMGRQLSYKGEWAGRSVAAVDRFFPSSKLCSCCGFLMKKMPLSVRHWVCPNCASLHDRDHNAAKNIRAAGLAVLAHGVAVNP